MRVHKLTTRLAVWGSAVALVWFAVGGAPLSFAQPTPTINYQGKLTDTNGLAVPNDDYDIRFRLYDAASGGTALWSETRTGGDQVSVTDGLFSVMLGEVTALTSVDFNQPLYLGVEIGGTSTTAWDGEMSPRKELGTVPAAFEARRLGGVASSSFLRGDIANSASALLSFNSGFISSASSTITELTTGTTTVTTLEIDGETITDITGAGLTNTSGQLAVATSSLNLTLDGLIDTTLTSPAAGELLSFTGGSWQNIATTSLGFNDHASVTLAGAPDYLTLSGQEITLGAIDLSADITGTLPISSTDLNVSATGLSFSGGDIALATGYAIPRTASTTNWNDFYNTPSTRISAGSGLSWNGNELNADVTSGDLHSEVTLAGENYLSLSGQEI
ncbi:MAG: hypothetical protein ACOC4E_02865, partial [Patescibacteria group bacterium]